jgi:hypothetical protein
LEIRSSKLRGRDLKKGILKGVGEKLEWNWEGIQWGNSLYGLCTPNTKP